MNEREHLEFLNAEDNIKKESSRKKKVVKTWTGLIGQVAGYYENGNELSGFIMYGEFRNWLMNYQLLKKSRVVPSYLVN